jgi:DNA-binding MarR family transcriptional regulator
VPRRPLPNGMPAERPIEIANRLNSAAIHLLRRIARDDGVDGVTGARLSALSVLVYGGPLSNGALARRERVSTPTMSRLVDALVRDGHVTRTEHAEDRRQTRLSPTDAGRALMERGRARRIERLAGELRGLAAADLDDMERALDVLEQLEQSTEATR